MNEDRSKGECLFKGVESIMTGEVELPDELCQWNDDVQVVEDELAIEISKT